jgi:hypothetical protein
LTIIVGWVVPGKSKKSDLKKGKKETNTERKNKLRVKRKESGLKAVTVFLDELTREELGKLCVNSGYDDPIKHPRSGTDALSNTIGALIRKASGITSAFACSNVKADQEFYNLCSIVFHRLGVGKGTNKDVAEFMTENLYPRPSIFPVEPDADETNPWTEADIETITGNKELPKITKKVEEEGGRSLPHKVYCVST